MVSIPWRTGVNMREFAYYGVGGLPNFFASAPLQRLQAEALRLLGVKLVRFYASQRTISAQDSANRVRTACDVLADHGMQAIICLDDAHAVAGWCVPGYDHLHSEVNSQYNKRFFTEDLWRNPYLTHISTIVNAVKDHPGVLMFELGNEYAIQPRVPEPNRADADAFLRFARAVSDTIKSIAPTKLVSTGLVNTRHIANLIEENPPVTVSRQLYSLPGIDAISIHYYYHDNERDNLANDVNMAKTLGKPFYIGEFGAEFGKIDRLAYYRSEFDAWRSAGAFTALPWAFDTSQQDVGISDIYSFARIKPDFDGLGTVMRAYAADVPPFSLTAKDAGSGTDSRSGSLAEDKSGSGTSGSGSSAGGTTGMGAFTLQYPMTWDYIVRLKFNDPAPNYSGNFVKKREGMLFAPQTAATNLPVLAAQRGRVSRVENYPPGYGKYVCIEHKWGADTFVTWYGHMDQISVKVGDNVNAGQQIGTAGRTGSADEISLFFTVQNLGKGAKGYVVNDVVDPLAYLLQAVNEVDEATLDAHVTIPDNSPFQAGAFLKKTWRVRNTGTKAWEGYTLAFFSGDPMGPGTAVPVPSTAPGATVQLSVDLVAPQTTGSQRSTWRLKNAQGEFFPNDLSAQIVVQPRDQGTRRPLARFVADVTIPDRTKMKPGTQFTKTWRILNDGNTVWDNTYKLVFERDEQMGGPVSVSLPPLRPRQSGDVSVTLTAPTNKTGIMRSTWQPTDPDGMPFDFEMYVEIDVDPTAGDPIPVNPQNIFTSPVQGNYRIGWRFNDPVNYGDGRHKGVDYVSPASGAPIVASGDGVVFSSERCGVCTPDRPNWTAHGITIAAATAQGLFSKPSQWNYGFGNLVIVRYEFNALPVRARTALSARGYQNGYAYVFYAHLQDIFVNAGARVTAGQQIGTLGNSGNSTAPHLHLEVRLGRDTRDYTRPIQLLNPEDMFSL